MDDDVYTNPEAALEEYMRITSGACAYGGDSDCDCQYCVMRQLIFKTFLSEEVMDTITRQRFITLESDIPDGYGKYASVYIDADAIVAFEPVRTSHARSGSRITLNSGVQIVVDYTTTQLAKILDGNAS